jgi:hypothetical protein
MSRRLLRATTCAEARRTQIRQGRSASLACPERLANRKVSARGAQVCRPLPSAPRTGDGFKCDHSRAWSPAQDDCRQADTQQGGQVVGRSRRATPGHVVCQRSYEGNVPNIASAAAGKERCLERPHESRDRRDYLVHHREPRVSRCENDRGGPTDPAPTRQGPTRQDAPRLIHLTRAVAHLQLQRRKIEAHCLPRYLEIHLEIAVGDDVPRADDLLPWNVGC